ncbi:PAS domain S-box protein [Hymenobacter sp. UYCo722]|uniref:PAS domain S-box protein n=1 Tax=Hymenobacter sp. UYCo722 TaxID=3156335 RepID=UPI003394CA11
MSAKKPASTTPNWQRIARQQAAEIAALRAIVAAQPAADTGAPDNLFEQFLAREQRTAALLSDADGRITWATPAFTALCGLPLPEVLGGDAASLLRPRLHDAATLAYIDDAARQQRSYQYEVPNPRPDGPTGWLRVKVQYIPDEGTGVVRRVAQLEDITDWRNAQVQLRESETRFRALTENVPGVVYELRQRADATVGFAYVSPKIAELFGIAVTEANALMGFVHPDDQAPLRRSLGQAVRMGTPWAFAGRLLVPGQPLRWFQTNAVITGRDAASVQLSGLLQDITPIKAAEQAVQESEARWRQAVEGLGYGLWDVCLTTQQVVFSPQYKAILGYGDADFPNAAGTWMQQVHPDDRARAEEAFLAHLRGDTTEYANEHRLRCRDGSYKWVLSRGLVTQRDAAGRPQAITGTQLDLSQLKEAREVLEASALQLAAVVANFQDGIVLEDVNRRIVRANDAFCRLLRLPTAAPQLAGMDGARLAEGLQRAFRRPAKYAQRLRELVAASQPAAGDHLVLTNGQVLQRDYVPLVVQGRCIGHLWRYEDITLRVRTAVELQRREEKYRGILDNMELGMVEVGLDNRVLYANQSIERITGFTPAELLGQEFLPLILRGESLQMVLDKQVLRLQGFADSYELAITTKAGTVKWVLVSGAPLYDDHRQVVGIVGIYLDLTPQKHLEESLRKAKAQAEESVRVKQEFLANISHEMRTPLNAILGMGQLLAKTTRREPRAGYLRAVTTSADNLLVIINDVLDLAKIEAGQVTVEAIGFRPADLLTQVAQTLAYKAEDKGLAFVTRVNPLLPAVLIGDPYRLGQILLNLASNAVKFTEQGSVFVACSLVTGAGNEVLVEFAVRDTGVGIDPKYLARVFDDFSQEDASVTRRFGGTGLGLGISRRLVELLGGELHLTSELGQGTIGRFSLRLPVGTADDLPSPDSPPDLPRLRRALRGKRVLLVEDNLFNRILARTILALVDVAVTEAENGQLAVDLAREQSFDLVLMDVHMPVMDGLEAARYLRQELGLAVPIVALTANVVDGEQAKCRAAGMDDFLSKPFREAALLNVVFNWAGQPHGNVVPVSESPTNQR